MCVFVGRVRARWTKIEISVSCHAEEFDAQVFWDFAEENGESPFHTARGTCHTSDLWSAEERSQRRGVETAIAVSGGRGVGGHESHGRSKAAF